MLESRALLPWSTSDSITCELAKSAVLAPPQTCWKRDSRHGPSNLCFNELFRWYWLQLNFQNHCSKALLLKVQSQDQQHGHQGTCGKCRISGPLLDPESEVYFNRILQVSWTHRSWKSTCSVGWRYCWVHFVVRELSGNQILLKFQEWTGTTQPGPVLWCFAYWN